MGNQHTPDDVIRLANEGRLEEWVHVFLESVGDNLPMSDGLRLQPRHWLGPVVIPLNWLQRCFGPEPSMEYIANKEHWEQRVTAMTAALAGGWSPPPLIAQFLGEGTFSLRDGNHRHEALRRWGSAGYWCVVWCDSPELRQQAERLLKGPQALAPKMGTVSSKNSNPHSARRGVGWVDAVDLFLQQHAMLFSNRVGPAEADFYVVDSLFTALTDTELRWGPPEKNSIAWYLWHVTRCEDLAINVIVGNRPQVFDDGQWATRLGYQRPDMGTGNTKAQVVEFSESVNLQALRDYRDAVDLQTRLVAREVDWTRISTEEDLVRVRQVEGIDPKEEWVYQRFIGKSSAWFFLWLAAGHLFWHVGQCRAIAREILANRPK